jgi:hypothetical protein
MGEAMVKPSRLRKEASRTAGTERSYLNILDNVALFGGVME